MKEHPRLTLGEDFAQEKSWRWENITVLTARLTLPQTKGESRREKRFDRYYRALSVQAVGRANLMALLSERE